MSYIDKTRKIVDLVPTLDTSAYASGDCFFLPIQISPLFLHEGGKASIESIVVVDSDKNASPFSLLFFNGQSAPNLVSAINAPFSILSSELNSKYIGAIDLLPSDYKTFATNCVATLSDVEFRIISNQSSMDLWIGGVINAAKTCSASGLHIRIVFLLEEK